MEFMMWSVVHVGLVHTTVWRWGGGEVVVVKVLVMRV